MGIKRLYREVITTAPEAYDYGYCFSTPMAWEDRNGNRVRLVLMPDENADYQIGRYQSGMHPAMTPDEFVEWQDLYVPVLEKEESS